MEIFNKKLTEITPYGSNPRNNEEAVLYVANSIREFGFRVPIVIDKNGIIVAGHTRYKAATKLGMESVPCVIADDLTEEQVRAYRVADNKVSEFATWDNELLSVELSDLLEIDMSDFGFDLEMSEDLSRIDAQGIGNGKNFEHTLKIDNTTVIMTDGEYESINAALDEYLKRNGVSFGFVGELLCNT